MMLRLMRLPVNQKDKLIKNSQEKLERVKVLQEKVEAWQRGVEALLETHFGKVELLQG